MIGSACDAFAGHHTLALLLRHFVLIVAFIPYGLLDISRPLSSSALLFLLLSASHPFSACSFGVPSFFVPPFPDCHTLTFVPFLYFLFAYGVVQCQGVRQWDLWLWGSNHPPIWHNPPLHPFVNYIEHSRNPVDGRCFEALCPACCSKMLREVRSGHMRDTTIGVGIKQGLPWGGCSTIVSLFYLQEVTVHTFAFVRRMATNDAFATFWVIYVTHGF